MENLVKFGLYLRWRGSGFISIARPVPHRGSMKGEEFTRWFMEELLPFLAKGGYFAENGESQTLEKCDVESVEKYVSSFASMPCFAKLNLKTPSGTVTREILIKFQSQDPIFREKMRAVPQYINETIFYNEVYPCFVEFLKSRGHNPGFVEKIIPKCYFASSGNGDEDKAVIILEDLRKYGFRVSDAVVDLDLNHCLMSVEKLAWFHAFSFAMKFTGWKPFEKLKHSFKEVILEDTPQCRDQCEEFQGYIIHRGIDYLLGEKTSEVPEEYLEKLRGMLTPVFELLKNLEAPREPLAVICHGDFNRNNILYKYVDGELVDAKLIDFQRVVYSSPSLDLGFLMYMNMNQEFREKHFEEVFEHYHSTLVKSISVILKESEKSVADRIPIQAFKEDFERVAISHYVTVSFFLPVMLAPSDEDDFEWDTKNLTNRQIAEKNYKRGGVELSKRISDVIVDFYRRKFYM